MAEGRKGQRGPAKRALIGKHIRAGQRSQAIDFLSYAPWPYGAGDATRNNALSQAGPLLDNASLSHTLSLYLSLSHQGAASVALLQPASL